MTRKKVKLAWIMSDSARKASLKKRRLGLIKKVSELTTLCGVNACLIVYSPDETQPVVWPSYEVARHMVIQFRSLPEMDQLKKMTNQETYLKERFTKSHDQVTKCHKKNKEVETGFLMHQIDRGRSLDDLSLSEMRGLVWMLDEKMKMIRKRIEFNQRAPYVPGSAPSGQYPPSTEGSSPGDETPALGGGPEPLSWDEWFMDMVNNEPKYAGTSSTRSDHMGFRYDNPYAGSVPDDHLGLPGHPYGGSSSASADMGMGLPRHPYGGSSSTSAEMGMGLPRHPYGGSSSASAEMGMGLPRHPYCGSSSASAEMGMGLPRHPYCGSSSASAEMAMGLPRHPYCGSSSASADMGMGLPPSPVNFRVPPTNMQGMAQPPFRPYGGVSDMGLPRGSFSGGSYFGSFGSDARPGGPNPVGGHIGSSSSAGAADQYGLPPVGFYRGNTNVDTANNNFVQPPFDGKNWPNNFSP